MANVAQIVNVVQALVLTQGDKMLLTPTYHVFDMYKVHQDAHSLVLQFNSPDYVYGQQKVPAINASASRDSLGAVHISIVNVDANKTITIRTSLQGLPSKSIGGQILTSAKVNDINTFDQPDNIHLAGFKGARREGDELVVTLPAHSVVMLELK
jgi:alpha-N-arabinofuranosidase